MVASEYMWVKLLKKWGGYEAGQTIRLGRSKGESRIVAGIAEEAKEPKPVETATLTPKAETAVLDRKAKAEAKAEAKAKARAEAEKKAKSEAEEKAKVEVEEKVEEKEVEPDNRKGYDNGWRK